MYAPRISPIKRMQGNGGDLEPLRSTTLPSPRKKGGFQVVSSPRMNGDYQVLKQNVDKQRLAVRQTRGALASSLDRLGEHHVRQKEYDDAMDAFAEALHEKRSVYSNLFALESNAAEGNFSRSSSLSSSVFDTDADGVPEVYDKSIDEIVQTLRNMGNVHSLRGEQDEAMRYYTEVTGLRASKKLTESASVADTRSLFSGLNNGEDTSALMSEINEDVKALDDLFRSISFRTGDGTSGMEKRKSTPLSPNCETRSSNKRRKGDNVPGSDVLENEPFKRSTSICTSTVNPGTKGDLGEALEMFRTVVDSYSGPNLEQHKEHYNSFSLRADLLVENGKQPMPSPTNRRDNQSSDASDLELAVEIYKQILSIQREMSDHVDNDPNLSANTASTLIRLGSVYYRLGSRSEELEMYREAKAVYKNAFGEDHSFVAGARKNIGMVLAERGEYDGAMQQFEKARKIYLAVHDGDEMNRDVASAVSCMGNVKNRVGDLDEALSHYVKALTIYKSIQESSMESDDSTNAVELANAMKDVTSTLKVIGMVHAKKGELDTAMGFFKEAMGLLQSDGVDSTAAGRETTASVLTRMASIHVKKNDLDQAMDHYREAYELTLRHRGSTNHQDIAGILHYIGGIHHKRGDYDEAMNCYQEAIRIYHSTLGPGNPTVAGTLVMVGSIHYKRRNLDSAMMFYREALRLNRDAYGLHHPDVAPILKSIGTIMTKKGEYGEAYDIFRDVLSIKCTVHGTGHPEVASAYKSLGNVHYKMGELADAERQYRHALSIYRRTKGDNHGDTIAARTTIEHLRYWMKERGKRKLEQRHVRNSDRGPPESDERSC